MDSAKEQTTEPTPVTVMRREPDVFALMDLMQGLGGCETSIDILRAALSSLPGLLDADHCGFVVRSPMQGAQAASRPAALLVTRNGCEAHSTTFPLADCPEVARVFSSGKEWIAQSLQGVQKVAGYIGVPDTVSPTSIALIPLMDETGAVAVLCIGSARHSDFSDRDVRHARAVADMIAGALRHTRTVTQLKVQIEALVSSVEQSDGRLKELARYFSIFENSRDAMLVLDQSGQLLFGNPKAEQLTECASAELRGLSFAELLPANEQALAKELIAGFQKAQFPVGIDFHLKTTKSKSLVCANFSGVLGDNEVVLVTLRDVSTERSLGRELAKTRDFLECVIESSVDGIVSADLRGNVLVYNRAASRIFGYSPDEVLGKLRTDDLYPEGIARDIMRRIESDAGGGRGRLEEHRVEMLTKSGEHVPVNLSASWVLDGERPIGTVGIFTDISEKLAMETSLAEAQRQLQDRQRQDAIAEVAGAAAHELNQPLTSVMGYAEFLKRAVEADPQLGHAVDVILTETQRMADIVRKVGRITRYETKPYVGGAKIVDLDRSSSPEKPSERPRAPGKSGEGA